MFFSKKEILLNSFFYVTIFLAIIMPSSGRCYEVQPMIQDITPFGQGSQSTLMIKNTRKKMLTVNIEAISVSINQYGKITEGDGSDIFTLPFSAIIPPGKSQTVIIRYLGEPEITSSKSFFLEVSEVPVDLEGGNISQVKTALTFQTLVNVVPPKAKSNVQVDSVNENSNSNSLNITLSNTGEKYTLINDTIWTFTPKIIFSDKKLKNKMFRGGRLLGNLTGGALLEPGKSLIYKLNSFEEIDFKKYTLTKVVSY